MIACLYRPALIAENTGAVPLRERGEAVPTGGGPGAWHPICSVEAQAVLTTRDRELHARSSKPW